MSSSEFSIAQSRGDAVIALLQRAEVAPVPAIYGAAYDYVAGVRTLSAARIGAMIRAPDAASQQRVYEEFTRPYETGEPFSHVVAQMVERLDALDSLIVERQKASMAHSAAMADVGAGLAGASPSLQLMGEWLSRLIQANDAVQRANMRLSADLAAAVEKLAAVREEVRKLGRDALVDPLTSVANRAGLDSALAGAIADAKLSRGLAIAVVDVDHFKRFNDTYGHQVGDAVLKTVARAMTVSVRSSDVVGRMGGDEFIAVLRDTGQAGALGAAEGIRRAVLDSDLRNVLGPGVLGGITVSIGVASYRDGDSLAALIERADAHLLAAKRKGRNRVIANDDSSLAEAS